MVRRMGQIWDMARCNESAQGRLGLFALAVCFALSACGWNDPGPRVRLHSPTPGSTSVPAPQSGATGSGAIAINSGVSHRVSSGETLYAISRQHRVSLKSLIVANGLEPPYRLTVGQRLAIPKSVEHRVQKGETLYGISRQYGVSLDSLVRLNRIAPPYGIKVGQRLKLPGRVAASGRTTTVAQSAPQPPASTTSQQQTGSIQPSSTQTASTTGGSQSSASTRPAAKPVEKPVADKVEKMTFQVTDAGLPRPRFKPFPPKRARAALPAPPARAGDSFLWPVKGRVLSGFGVKGKGLHNDGLNIAAPRGAPVRAAENGVVAYSGTEIKGFGNMILLKHSGGFLTAYAHNGELLVARGEVIRRGQTIAKVGSTGNVDSPQLHFQVRRKGKSVNPAKYLGG